MSARRRIQDLRTMAGHLRTIRDIIQWMGHGIEQSCPVCDSDLTDRSVYDLATHLESQATDMETFANEIETRLNR